MAFPFAPVADSQDRRFFTTSKPHSAGPDLRAGRLRPRLRPREAVKFSPKGRHSPAMRLFSPSRAARRSAPTGFAFSGDDSDFHAFPRMISEPKPGRRLFHPLPLRIRKIADFSPPQSPIRQGPISERAAFGPDCGHARPSNSRPKASIRFPCGFSARRGPFTTRRSRPSLHPL